MRPITNLRNASRHPSEHSCRAPISGGIYIRPITLALASLLILEFDVEGGTGPVFGILGLTLVFPAFIARCWIYQQSHHYFVTNKGLRLCIGSWAMLRRSESFLPSYQIEAVLAEQGLFGRLFNYGHVYVTATGSRQVVLRWVRNPDELMRRISGLAATCGTRF